MVRALMKEDVSYLHLLTGEDFPLYPAEKLDEMFAGSDRIYMSFIRPKDQPREVSVRYRYRNLFVNADMKNKVIWQLQDWAGKLQEKAGMVRDSIGDIRSDSIYKGLVYISMPRDAAEYALGFITGRGASFWKELRSCQVPEEFFFQTVFMNSPAFSERVVDKELRYMDWTRGDGSSPAYLSDGDLDAVLKARDGGCCFARKFHPVQSAGLRKKLRELIG